MAAGETESVSIFSLRRVKTLVIWLKMPTIFSENMVGILSQITSVFTRRRLNIETLSVSPSAIEGIHKFTITVFSDFESMKKVVLQIDKRVDVLKAYFNVDDELIYQEIALYKLSTPVFLQMDSAEPLIRKYNARILEINENCVVLEKTGHYQETQDLFKELSETVGVLQFIRSGRIAITKSKVERLSDMLKAIEDRKNGKDRSI
jgi:acetolactate synthase-1/3 small subunit